MAATGMLQQIQKELDIIKARGSFVFDVDGTLLPADESIEQFPALIVNLLSILEAGIPVGIISGSPGKVLENRIAFAMAASLKEKSIDPSKFVLYVNGGSTKYIINSDYHMEEAREYGEAHSILYEEVLLLKKNIENFIQSRFGLNSAEYDQLIIELAKARENQWGAYDVEFRDVFKDAKKCNIDFWHEEAMAAVKSGQASKETISFPFINLRGIEKDEKGDIHTVKGVSPSGFYSLRGKRTEGSSVKDIRDMMIPYLEEKTGGMESPFNFKKAGRSTIDITKKGTDKACALRDFTEIFGSYPESSYYFGDEFFPGGNDEPLLQNSDIAEGWNFCAISGEELNQSNVFIVGKSVADLHKFVGQAVLHLSS